MARPKGSKNKGAPSTGHNSKAPPPIATAADIAMAVAEYGDARGVSMAAAAKCSAVLSRWEKVGVNKVQVRNTWKIAQQTQAQAADEFATLARYLIVARVMSVADVDWTARVTQGDLMPAAGDAADLVTAARARAFGVKAGRKGATRSANPYSHTPGSPEFVGWLDGLQEGHALRAEMKPGSENIREASTSRERREPGQVDLEDAIAEAPLTHDEIVEAVADEMSALVGGIKAHPTVQ